MLEPGEVGVSYRGHSITPADVVTQLIAAPVGTVERRVGEDVVSLEIRVQVFMEAVPPARAKIRFDTADGQVHLRQTPGGVIELLAINCDVVPPSPMRLDEALS